MSKLLRIPDGFVAFVYPPLDHIFVGCL